MKFLKVVSVILAGLALCAVAVHYGGGFKLSTPVPATGSVSAEGQGDGVIGPVVRLDPFVVSESEGDGQHMSTVTFEVEVSDADGRDALKSRISAIRSGILTVLADTKLSDVGDPEDFAKLKQKVQGSIQTLLPEHIVRRVLITEFLSL